MPRIPTITALAGLLIAVTFSGCTGRMDYRTAFINTQARAVQPAFQGTAVMMTTPESDAKAIKKHPSGVVGGANAIAFPAGQYLREIGLETYRRAFAGGASHASEVPVPGGTAIIIQPQLMDFTYKIKMPLFKQVNAVAQVSLRVTYRDAAGSVLKEADYSSGYVPGDTTFESDPTTVVNRAVHQAFWVAFQQSVADLKTMPQVVPGTSGK